MIRPSFAPALLASLLLAGCGGGGSSSSSPSTKGTASLSVAWPSRDGRLLPSAANSIVATLTLNGTVAATQTLSRPTGGGKGVANFTKLAYGTYVVGVKAYPTADGTGVAQAVGAGGMTVAEDAPGTADVALASTATALAILPVTFDKGSIMTVAASATDSTGAIVLLSAGGGSEPLAWSVDATSIATLVASGASATLTGVHSGSTTVRASLVVDDLSHTITASAPVTVNVVNDGVGTVTIH